MDTWIETKVDDISIQTWFAEFPVRWFVADV